MALSGIGLSTRRNQLTIMTDLLETVQEPQRLTHILYKSNMSYSQLVKYLNDMIKLKLVEEHSKPFRSFSITSKGIQFLEMIDLKDNYTDQKNTQKPLNYV